MLVPLFGHRLREVDVNPPLVYEHALHLEVGLVASLFFLELNERVLQTVTSFPVSDDVAANYLAKAGEYQFQVVLLGDWVELANKEDVLGRLDLGVREVIDYFKYLSPRLCLVIFSLLLHLLLGHVCCLFVEVHIIFNVHCFFRVQLKMAVIGACQVPTDRTR